MEILKLVPSVKDLIWGGNKLRDYGKISAADNIAESWELSFHKDGLTTLENGKTLKDSVKAEELGKNVTRFKFFPVLVKFIDAARDLSVQVHPSDEYALKNENSYGKTEMWYIVEAEEGAGIYLGFNRDVGKEEYAAAINNNTVLSLLNFYKVKKGDCFFIKSGTVHAIGKGVLLCEIQQNSNLTYRVYDYGRLGKDGKPRQLHIEKAKEVSNLKKFENRKLSAKSVGGEVIGASKYFTASKITVNGALRLFADTDSFVLVTCVSGSGKIEDKIISKGDSFFVPAGYGEINLSGNAELIKTEIMKYYIGIDVGGTFLKGGIIDEKGKIIFNTKIPTESENGADGVTDNICKLIDLLLQGSNMSVSDIEGIGMGVPGMIDSKNGVVIFSNNLNWHDVKIAEKISDKFNIKVKIANDANVAALGEAVFGAGSEYNDSVLITLGTGVGSGIIIGKKLFEGNQSAGAEIGHMVIVDGGEKCTCGRRGCFEAYASATALIRNTKNAMVTHKDSKMWEIGGEDKVTGKTAFDYKDKDVYAKEVVDNYIEKLACGIANIANIFRPEVVMLGGGVCAQGDNLIIPLQKQVNKEIFAGCLGPAVPVVTANLGNDAGILGAAALVIDK